MATGAPFSTTRRTAGLLAAAALALAVTAPIQAQELGSLIPKKKGPMTTGRDDGVWVAHRLAGCLYMKRRGSVRTLLDTTDAGQRDTADGLLSREVGCSSLTGGSPFATGTSIAYSPDVFRGMLAEAALSTMGDQIRALKALPPEPPVMRPWFAMTGREAVVDSMAICVAESNPQGVATLLDTPAESESERAAVGNLGPSLGPCLLTGATLKANRLSLRAALAEAMYHRITAPSTASQAVQ